MFLRLSIYFFDKYEVFSKYILFFWINTNLSTNAFILYIYLVIKNLTRLLFYLILRYLINVYVSRVCTISFHLHLQFSIERKFQVSVFKKIDFINIGLGLKLDDTSLQALFNRFSDSFANGSWNEHWTGEFFSTETTNWSQRQEVVRVRATICCYVARYVMPLVFIAVH